MLFTGLIPNLCLLITLYLLFIYEIDCFLEADVLTMINVVNVGRGQGVPSGRPSLVTVRPPGSDQGRVTQMLGTAELTLPEHRSLVTDSIAARLGQSTEVTLRLADGQLTADALILAGVSPFLKSLLLEALFLEPGDWVRDECPVLLLPDVTMSEMRILLSLLYTGTTRVIQAQLSSLVTLTHLLKLISIPVAIVDEPVVKKTRSRVIKDNQTRAEKATITFIPNKINVRGRPAKILTTSAPKDPKLETLPSDFLINNKTKLSISSISIPPALTSEISSKLIEVVPSREAEKKSHEPGIMLSEAESDFEEMVEEMQVFVSDEGHVERLELLHDNTNKAVISVGSQDSDKKTDLARVKTPVLTAVLQSDPVTSAAGEPGTVTLVQTEEGEGLDNLISVAEAFERSQQPDFNDIASPVVDGTDTERHLVRNCSICSKSLLGRNALGRHMKNVHPAVFGPYRCTFSGCAKMIESGVKMMSHMYHHTGGRTRHVPREPEPPPVQPAESETEKSPVKTDKEPETEKKPTFICNAGAKDCSESFSTARNFVKHMKEIHKMKPWYCEPCDKRFMERQNLQFHVMGHGDKKNFACDICNKSFANPRQLYTHRALHLGKRYLCQECGFRARSSANLRGHVKQKHEAKQHNCKMCDKKFSSGNNLKNHMRIHTGEAPYKCELCGVKFKRVHHLHSHIESKLHIEVMDKHRRKGQAIPQHLDPLRRARGRAIVEDGPVTLASSQPQLETHITEVVEDGWPLQQVVVVEEGGSGVGESFSIPVDQAQIEIIQDTAADIPGDSYILSV